MNLIQEATVRESVSPGSGLRINFNKADDELLQIERADSSESEPVSPGIYAVSLIPTKGDRHPCRFYIRVNRSASQEREIEELLGNPIDTKVIARLGKLRSHEAVPKLIKHFMAAKDCEQAASGMALAMIGDARAAKAFLQIPNLYCYDTSWSSQEWLRAFDPAARKVCSESLSELGTHLLENWPRLSAKGRQLVLDSVILAFYNCERPLSENQLKIGKELISLLAGETRYPDGPQRSYTSIEMSSLIVAYLGNESDRITGWLRATKDEPGIVLAFLREFGWPARMEQTGFDYSRQCLLPVFDELTEWKSHANLTEEQKLSIEEEIAHVKSAMEERGQ